MKLLKKNQTVTLLPEDVNGACTGRILKSLKDTFEVEVPQNEFSYYKEGEIIELFSPAEDGVLYFTAPVAQCEENVLKVKMPSNFETLQRREFTRIAFEKDIALKDEDIKCKCIDISAGGMKIETDKQLDMDKDYTVSFKLENNSVVNCFLRPIRITKEKAAKYIVSGRFVLLKNIDKIAIVQYCFKKQIEDRNK